MNTGVRQLLFYIIYIRGSNFFLHGLSRRKWSVLPFSGLNNTNMLLFSLPDHHNGSGWILGIPINISETSREQSFFRESRIAMVEVSFESSSHEPFQMPHILGVESLDFGPKSGSAGSRLYFWGSGGHKNCNNFFYTNPNPILSIAKCKSLIDTQTITFSRHFDHPRRLNSMNSGVRQLLFYIIYTSVSMEIHIVLGIHV